MTAPLDLPIPVRAGEALDAAALEGWLGANAPELAGPLTIAQFPSGHSNLTYLVTVGARELVLRRPPFGAAVKHGHDMGREYRILSKLSAVYSPAPKPAARCDDPAVLGAPFYLMERIPGVILRRKNPDGLVTPEVAQRLSEAFVDNLARLHAIDYAAAGLGDLGHPDGYVRRQVEGWTARYAAAKTDDIDELPRLAAWLAGRIPQERGAALLHNDYKYDNLVLDPGDVTRIVGVLDWEMATIGDPLMDLGTALGYWVEAGDADEMRALTFGPTDAAGSLTRQALIARYARQSGRDCSGMLFYYCFALFKLAVVLQQIYARYKRGDTKDERFAPFIFAVQVLGATALRAAERGTF